MIRRRVAALYIIASVIISVVLTFVVGTAYLDARIERGITESKVVDARVDKAFEGLCGILLYSSRPFPRPPSSGDKLPAPTTPYGKELEKYNKRLAARQAEGLALTKAAVDEYHCRR